MLKKFDIVAYKTHTETLNLGTVIEKPKKEERTVEIAELTEATPGDSSTWIISNHSNHLNKNSILFIITKAKIVGKRSIKTNFRVEFKGFDVSRILALKEKTDQIEEDEEKEEEEETNLKKRRKRGKGKKKATKSISDYFKVFEYEGEIIPDDKIKKQQKKVLPSFMRTATTNLRFELPDFSEDFFGTPEPLNFSSINFKSDKQTVLKSLSQDLSLIFNQEKDTRVKFIDVCQNVLKEIDDKYGEKLKNPLNLQMANKEFVNVPSKEEMNQTLNYFSSAIGHLRENLEGDTEGLYYLLMANIFFFILRFFMSHENSKLHLLKNKMYLDNFELNEETGIKRLTTMFEALLKFVKTIKNLLTENFTAEYLSLLQKNCSLIGDFSEEVIDSDQMLDTKAKIKVKKHLATTVMKVIEELMMTEKSESKIIQIFVSILKNVNFNNIHFNMSGKQSFLAKRLNSFYNERMNHTNKRWNLFVDSCCQFIRNNRMEDIHKIQSDREMIDSLTHRMLSIQTSLAKGLYLSALRVVLDEQVKKTTEGEGFGDDMNQFLSSLLEGGDKLPIFIYFVQSMSRIHGDIEELAKSKNIKSLESFVQKFMFESGMEQAENLKYCPKEYQEYIETKNRLFFILGGKGENEVLEIFKEALLKVKLTKEEQDSYFDEKENYFMKRNLAWIVFLNEIYISYVSDEAFEQRDLLIEIFEKHREEAFNDFSRPQVEFLSLLLQNFNGDSILSLNSKQSKDEIQIKISIVQSLITLLLTSNSMLGKFSDESDNFYTNRGQLAALPGKAEEKYLLIANTFYGVDSNWRSDQQFTKLYKCSCGYLYWIGDCGRAWVIANCPSCKKQIGGTSHNLVNSDNVEITKEHFFNEMYGPLEAISGKIYQVRSLDGKYSKIESENGKMEEENEEMKEGTMEEENPGDEEKDEGEQSSPKNEGFMSIRSMGREGHFVMVEFVSHCRYLLDFLVGTEEQKKAISDFIQLKNGDYFNYFYDLISYDYKKIKKEEFPSLNKEQYFKGMTLILREDLLEKLEKNKESNRNETEELIVRLFDLVKPNFSNNVLQRIEMKKDLDGNLTNSSKLVKDWVNRLASIKELKEKNSDIKVISAMRINKTIDMENLKEFLNSRLQEEEVQETGDEETAQKIKFLINVIGLEPILLIINKMLFSHIDFCNYLQYLFDFRLTYKLACSISINDLISEEEIEDDSTETDEDFKKLRRSIIERNRNDITIISKFNSLKESWKNIMKYREQFADLFDFRFLCHATEMPQEKIDEIFNVKTAKLIFFLPNEKYVESLFITSALQTLGNIQNNLIENNQKEFFRANYTNPSKIPIQNARKSDLIGLSSSLKEIIQRCSFANLNFNKDEEMVYNIDMIDRELAIELFFGRKVVSIEADYLKSFNFSREFNHVANYVSEISLKFGQTFLDKSEKNNLIKACEYDIEETFCIFSRKLRELSEHKFDLAVINKFKDEKDEFIMNFECQHFISEGEKVITDEKENSVVANLNKAKITLNNVRFVYEEIEERMYKLGLKNLEAHLNIKIPEGVKENVKGLISKLTEEEKILLRRVAKAMVLRQLVASTNEKIGESEMKVYLEYSDALHSDEEINSELLENLSSELKLHHLPEFINLLV